MALSDATRRRFERLTRLFGEAALERLVASRVVVFGIGGVGSFAAEALVRSAIGQVILVDFDLVAESNINRQLPALADTVGQPKAEVLTARLRAVNPEADIRASICRYDAEHSDELLAGPYDAVVDCIDNMTAKAHLLATCRARRLAVFASMGAGGRRDPTRVRVADLSETTVCRLAKDLRKILRRKHGFPERERFGIPAVYSVEQRSWPREVTAGREESTERNLIDGTAGFVTGTFGLTVASVVVGHLLGDDLDPGPPAADRRGFRRGASA